MTGRRGSPRVAVIGCGGTISTLAHDPFDTLDCPETGPKLSARQVVARMPDLARFARGGPVPVRALGRGVERLQRYFEDI